MSCIEKHNLITKIITKENKFLKIKLNYNLKFSFVLKLIYYEDVA